jgi:hypothetical protein
MSNWGSPADRTSSMKSWPATAPLANHVTRILAVVVAGPVTTQPNVALVFAVLTAESAMLSV